MEFQPLEIMKDHCCFHNSIHICRAHSNHPVVDSPLCSKNSKGILNYSSGSGLGEVSSRIGPQHIPPEGKSLITHKDMRHGPQVICTWERSIFWEMEIIFLQCLSKSRGSKGPSITIPTKSSNIHYPKKIPCIHNSQKYNRVCSLVIIILGA